MYFYKLYGADLVHSLKHFPYILDTWRCFKAMLFLLMSANQNLLNFWKKFINKPQI